MLPNKVLAGLKLYLWLKLGPFTKVNGKFDSLCELFGRAADVENPVYTCGAEPKAISCSNALNARGPETPSMTNPRTIIKCNSPRSTTAKSNANARLTPRSEKTCLHLPVPGMAREVG